MYLYILKILKSLLPKFITSILSRIYAFLFCDVKTGFGVIYDPRNISEGENIIQRNSEIYNSKLGRYSYVATNSIIYRCEIGRYCSIGSWVKVGIGRHPIDFISSHPAFHSSKTSRSIGFKNFLENKEYFQTHKMLNKKFSVKIGSDVWIGDRVVIMGGLEIGDGAIVGVGSVVTKNVKPYEIVGGVPAKKIKSRFSKNEIKKLLQIQWWNKDENWIKKNAKAFCSIKNLNYLK
jgi:acetyltransferase-like isoleucine patch superfamily enzyme